MLKTETESEARSPLPLLPCTCSNLRRAARVVTRLYNRALQSDRIESTQFTLLMALDQVGEIYQADLAKIGVNAAIQPLDNAARPMNLNGFNDRIRPKPKVSALIT